MNNLKTSILLIATLSTIGSVAAITDVTTEVNNIKASSSDVGTFGKIIQNIFNSEGEITGEYLELDETINASDTHDQVPSSKAVQDLFDTGIDTLWNTNGTDKIYYSSGSVGIGTDDPEQRLDIVTENDYGAVTLRNYGTGHPYYGGFRAGGTIVSPLTSVPVNTTNALIGWAYANNQFNQIGRVGILTGDTFGDSSPSESQITFDTGLGRAMVIKNNGNVGIGTITPDTKLSIGSGQLGIPLGSEAVPSIAFNSELDTGFFRYGPGDFGFSSAGGNIFSVRNVGGSAPFKGQVLINNTANRSYPSYSFLDDSNTGMYQKGADQINFSNGGTDTVSILSNGYVGIGTSTPDMKFSVREEGTGDYIARFHNSSSSSNPYQGIRIGTNVSGVSGGPVYSDIIVSKTGGKDIFGISVGNSSGDSGLSTQLDSDIDFAISRTGNVGIGTVDPSQKLEVRDGMISVITDGSDVARLNLLAEGTGEASIVFDAQDGDVTGADYSWIGQQNDGDFFVINNGAERITVKPSGNVGIGTSNPNNKLSVNGDALFNNINATGETVINKYGNDQQNGYIRGSIEFSRDGDVSFDGTNWSKVGGASSDWSAIFGRNDSLGILTIPTATFSGMDNATFRANYERITINQSSGNVGIGSLTPSSKLEVGGKISSKSGNATAAFSASDANGSVAIVANDNRTNSNPVITFGSSQLGAAVSEHMRVDDDGDLGIGTTNPTNRLAIEGGGIDLNSDTDGDIASIYEYNGGLVLSSQRQSLDEHSLIITTSNNVGIGESNPTSKLDVAGTGRFTGTLTAATPTAATHLTTKAYVDDLVNGLSWKEPVVSSASATYGACNTAKEAWATFNKSDNIIYVCNGSAWVQMSSTVGLPNLAGEVTGPITSNIVANNTIDSANVIANSLTAADLALDSVGASELANNSVGSANVIINSLTAADLALDSVGASELANNSVGSANVIVDSLTAVDLAPSSVGNSELNNTANFTMNDLTITGVPSVSKSSIQSYENLVHYSGGSTVTGTMKITMPKAWSSTMGRTVIKGYNYNSIGAWEVIVSGYNYSAGSWVNTSAEIRGTAPFSQVRLAYDGSKVVILLGNTSTTWSYPKILVSEFDATFSAITGWANGWSIAPITSEAGITAVVSPTLYNVNSNLVLDDLNDVSNADNSLYVGTTTGNAGTESLNRANIALGQYNLQNTTSGYYNTALGYNNMSGNTSGYENTSVGFYAMRLNQTGDWNTAVGSHALEESTGGYNVGIGGQSLTLNTGNNNSAVGFGTLLNNTSGNDNSAQGFYALRNNTTGNYNNAVGANALYSNTDTTGSTAMGYSALYNNDRNYNAAFGYQAALTNTTGYMNTAIGAYRPLYRNTTGSYNVGVGGYSLYNSVNGSGNVGVGYQTMYRLTSGSYNVALGYHAGRYTGVTQTDNNASSSNSIYMGYRSRPLASGQTNQIVIGHTAVGAGSNTATIGNSNITKTILQGEVTGGSFVYSSDRRLKKNISTLKTPLEKIKALEGVDFTWKKDDKKSIGLIAQDVEKIYPELVHTNETTGMKAVEYGNLVAPLIEAVKQQQKMIDEQGKITNEQAEMISEQSKKIEKLQIAVDLLK